MGLSCRTLQIYVPIRQFFYDLIHPDYSAVTDVYVLMFLADTVDFIIIVFGFWAFGVGWVKGLHSSTGFQKNRFPSLGIATPS